MKDGVDVSNEMIGSIFQSRGNSVFYLSEPLCIKVYHFSFPFPVTLFNTPFSPLSIRNKLYSKEMKYEERMAKASFIRGT